MASKSSSDKSSAQLLRFERFKKRQSDVKWGPDYETAIRAVKGEAPPGSSPGTLPATRLGRFIHAMSWPEKVAASLALYADPFELHDQHVFYPTAKQHPLAYHPLYLDRPWPFTEGTFALAEKLDVLQLHPMAMRYGQTTASSASSDSEGTWEIGSWIGDLLLYLKDESGTPYLVFWDVKQKTDDHGRPGGDPVKRLSAIEVARAKARSVVCAAYAEQLGSRIVDFNLGKIPPSLATTLVCLCRASAAEIDLPTTAMADLVLAYQDGVGAGTPPREIAKRIVSSSKDLHYAKSLFEVAVWQRKVRVDLNQPVIWNRPLLPERKDVLTEFSYLFSR